MRPEVRFFFSFFLTEILFSKQRFLLRCLYASELAFGVDSEDYERELCCNNTAEANNFHGSHFTSNGCVQLLRKNIGLTPVTFVYFISEFRFRITHSVFSVTLH